MPNAVMILALLVPACASAQTVASSYATRDGRVGTVVIACPTDRYNAGACPAGTPSPVTYAPPLSSNIATANVAVSVFGPGTITNGCDIVNTGTLALYVDLANTAAIGSTTSLPLQPGQAFHCPFPPIGAVSAVAAQPQPFVAVRY